MIKALLTGLLITCLFVTTAQADLLGSAFSSLATPNGGMSNTTSTQTFRSETSQGVSFGGQSIRYPNKTIQLMSITKPSFHAGCNGIDAHLGGFSFISTDQLVEDLKLIAQGVPALLYQMALKAIAAPIINVVQRLESKLNKVTQALASTCQASKALTQGLSTMTAVNGHTLTGAAKAPGVMLGATMDAVGKLASGWFFSDEDDNDPKDGSPAASHNQFTCGLLLMGKGIFNDLSSAKSEGCGGTRASKSQAESIHDAVKGDKGLELRYATSYGNITWNALQAAGIAPSTLNGENSNASGVFGKNFSFAYLIFNMMGSKIIHIDSTKSGDGNSEHPSPTITPKQPTLEDDGESVFYAFMCGTKSFNAPANPTTSEGNNLKWAANWCKNKGFDPTAAQKPIWICQDEDDAKKWMNGCTNMKLSTVEDLDLGKGMLFNTITLLSSAVKKAHKANATFTPRERTLISMAPFPLYKVINIAASSPTIANQMLQNNARVLAFYLTQSTIFGIFRNINQSIMDVNANGNPNKEIPAISAPTELRAKVMKAVSGIQHSSNRIIQKIGIFSNTKTALMQNVRAVNSQVLKDTMAMGLGGRQFVQALTDKITGQ